MSNTTRELRHILESIPLAIRNWRKLPDRERAFRWRGLPKHVVDLVALASFRLIPERAKVRESGAARKHVLLVHGYAGHPKSHLPLRLSLQKAGFATHSIDLRATQDAEGMADRLGARALELGEQFGPIVIVAHSLGGLITRLALERQSVQPHVSSIVTLGTPQSVGHLKREKREKS